MNSSETSNSGGGRLNKGNNNHNRNGGTDSSNNGREKDGQQNRTRPGTRKYFWSHGLCAHSIPECERKTEGRINTATAINITILLTKINSSKRSIFSLVEHDFASWGPKTSWL